MVNTYILQIHENLTPRKFVPIQAWPTTPLLQPFHTLAHATCTCVDKYLMIVTRGCRTHLRIN